MKHLSISVPTPCHEKWETFTPTEKGAHCKSCQMEVIDFSSWSEEKLITYLKKNRQGCGRFQQDQLKQYQIQKPISRSRHWLSAFILNLILLCCEYSYADAQEIKQPQDSVEQQLLSQPSLPHEINEITVSGIVTSSIDGLPLSGVHISRARSYEVLISDANGLYSITINNPNKEEKLIFSFVGYERQEIAINTISSTSSHVFLTSKQLNTPDGLLGFVGGYVAGTSLPDSWLWGKVKGIFIWE
jgi:CarboxypepD_reg-like domain